MAFLVWEVLGGAVGTTEHGLAGFACQERLLSWGYILAVFPKKTPRLPGTSQSQQGALLGLA